MGRYEVKKSLIFCPVGIPVAFHPPVYDPDNHWRYTKENRLYDVVVYPYNDIEVEPNTYDYIVKGVKGYKWQIAKKFLTEFDYSQYEYIAFFDDDLITDIQNINNAITVAQENDIKIFQLSMLAGSECSHGILIQNPEWEFSRVSFNEGMGPFIHISLIPILLDFWKFHDVKSGYGFDAILTKITNQAAGVIHSSSMFHPPSTFKGYVPSYYNKNEADAEMAHIFNTVYPDFMYRKYGLYVSPLKQLVYYLYEVVPKGNDTSRWDISYLKQTGQWESKKYISASGLVDVVKNINADTIMGVEIGVASGWNMNHFLANIPNLNLTGIDAYLPFTDWNGAYVSEKLLDAQFRAATKNISEFSDRSNIIKMKSDDAASQFADESLDYIFVDGDHSYEGCLKDLQNYYPKLKKGGLFSGHDFTVPDVNRAINEFRKDKNFNPISNTYDNVWYWFKSEE